MRSGMMTGLILTCVLVGLGVAYRAHMQGNFHKFKAKMRGPSGRIRSVPQPGGQEAAVLMRTRPAGDSTPEFLSATILPGRGMNVLQITAYLPGKGEVNLMASPSVEGAASAMTGKGADADGQASLAMGGAFEAPWAGKFWGNPAQAGSHVTTVWRGHSDRLCLRLGVAAEASRPEMGCCWRRQRIPRGQRDCRMAESRKESFTLGILAGAGRPRRM